MKKLLISILSTAAAAAMAGASFSYQGALRNADGSAITGDLGRSITFRLYADATGNEALWEREFAVRLDADGLFNVEICDGETTGGATLDEVLAANAETGLFIGLTVANSTGEIRPRQKLLSVPTAVFAKNVKHANSDFTVDGTAALNGGAIVNTALKIEGPSEFHANATFNGDVSLVGSTRIKEVVGETHFASNLKVTGSETVGGNETVAGDLKVEGAIHDKYGELLPHGVILMWSGAANAIPAGWVLCDGSNNTPDLRGRFIVGAGKGTKTSTSGDVLYDVKDKGGASSVTLATDNLPSHTHEIKLFEGSTDKGLLSLRQSSTDDDDSELKVYARDNDNWRPKIMPTGGNVAHENRPPYYALCYIMKK